ncbi:hypothetical protein DIPPA_33409 [Diplonema papillatum]|nr:hypothetical protein DIPPA_33409 [Diplonema papillatum]
MLTDDEAMLAALAKSIAERNGKRCKVCLNLAEQPFCGMTGLPHKVECQVATQKPHNGVPAVVGMDCSIRSSSCSTSSSSSSSTPSWVNDPALVAAQAGSFHNSQGSSDKKTSPGLGHGNGLSFTSPPPAYSTNGGQPPPGPSGAAPWLHKWQQSDPCFADVARFLRTNGHPFEEEHPLKWKRSLLRDADGGSSRRASSARRAASKSGGGPARFVSYDSAFTTRRSAYGAPLNHSSASSTSSHRPTGVRRGGCGTASTSSSPVRAPSLPANDQPAAPRGGEADDPAFQELSKPGGALAATNPMPPYNHGGFFPASTPSRPRKHHKYKGSDAVAYRFDAFNFHALPAPSQQPLVAGPSSSKSRAQSMPGLQLIRSPCSYPKAKRHGKGEKASSSVKPLQKAGSHPGEGKPLAVSVSGSLLVSPDLRSSFSSRSRKHNAHHSPEERHHNHNHHHQHQHHHLNHVHSHALYSNSSPGTEPIDDSHQLCEAASAQDTLSTDTSVILDVPLPSSALDPSIVSPATTYDGDWYPTFSNGVRRKRGPPFSNDVLFMVFQYLYPEDAASARKACKVMNTIGEDGGLWQHWVAWLTTVRTLKVPAEFKVASVESRWYKLISTAVPELKVLRTSFDSSGLGAVRSEQAESWLLADRKQQHGGKHEPKPSPPHHHHHPHHPPEARPENGRNLPLLYGGASKEEWRKRFVVYSTAGVTRWRSQIEKWFPVGVQGIKEQMAGDIVATVVEAQVCWRLIKKLKMCDVDELHDTLSRLCTAQQSLHEVYEKLRAKNGCRLNQFNNDCVKKLLEEVNFATKIDQWMNCVTDIKYWDQLVAQVRDLGHALPASPTDCPVDLIISLFKHESVPKFRLLWDLTISAANDDFESVAEAEPVLDENGDELDIPADDGLS